MQKLQWIYWIHNIVYHMSYIRFSISLYSICYVYSIYIYIYIYILAYHIIYTCIIYIYIYILSLSSFCMDLDSVFQPSPKNNEVDGSELRSLWTSSSPTLTRSRGGRPSLAEAACLVPGLGWGPSNTNTNCLILIIYIYIYILNILYNMTYDIWHMTYDIWHMILILIIIIIL